MNRVTFKDMVKSTKSSGLEDLDDEEEDDDQEIKAMKEDIEGEEEDGDDRFNDAGEVLEPFNMKNERDRGTIDESGSYYFTKEKNVQDAWLEDMDEAAMEKGIGEAAEGLRKRKELLKEREEAEANMIKKTPLELKLELLGFLLPFETVGKAMRRYGGKDKKNNNTSKEKKQFQKVSVEDRKKIERITEIADQLLSQDAQLTGIYEMTYESIQASTVSWEYKDLTGAVQGPFTSLQISEWKRQSFFTGANAVMMRKINPVVMSSSDSSSLLPGNKKAKTEEKKEASHIELERDFESDDDDDDDADSEDGLSIAQLLERDRLKKENALKQANNNNQSGISIAKDNNSSSSNNENNNNWVSSEDLDFGEYNLLPENDGNFNDEDNDDDEYEE